MSARHDHSRHGHAGHSHGLSADADSRKILVALALILGLMIAEVVAGAIAHSLALLSDAAHMLTDAAALGLSLVAIRLAARPAKGILTYGLKRVEILAAQANGVTLVILATFIAVEAVRRLVDPPNVEGRLVLIVAIVGIAVNLVAVWVLAGANRRSLNVEGSFQHILTDLYAFVATAIAGAVVLWTGLHRADAVASLLVAALMYYAAWGLLRDSGRVFLEAAPAGIHPDEVGRSLAAEPDVAAVHDLHLWEITSGYPALTAHVLVDDDCDCHATRVRLAELLRDTYGIEHATLQVDHVASGHPATVAGCPQAHHPA